LEIAEQNNNSESTSVDVIVIGAGFAGLAAAIAAAEAGASVIILEKMKAPGGNSIISDGGIAAPGTSYQEDCGIDDSVALLVKDMLAAGQGLNYPELVDIVAGNAKDAFLWSRDVLGVKYMNRVDIFGGHSVPRCYTPEGISGASLIKGLLESLKKLDVSIICGAQVSELRQDGAGKVCGVKFTPEYSFNKPSAATEKALQARRAVIVASGGFGGDVGFRLAQDPRLDHTVMSTNKPSTTAEMLKECLRIGANPVQLSRIQLGAWASPDEQGFGLGPLFGDYVVIPYGLIVDPSTSARFTNELKDRQQLAEAILSRQHPVVGISDHANVAAAGWDLSKAIKKGIVHVHESLASLASDRGMMPDKLVATVDRFNAMIDQGEDTDYQKTILQEALRNTYPPFYSMRMWPKVHHTMGGMQIDTCARVVHRDQYVIRGLYAAGEVAAGVHGACRLGCCAITECLVIGRIAGENAALLSAEDQ